ncbi:hypothetical protein GCM10020255_033330 [Rhodococcus baikonurensis]
MTEPMDVVGAPTVTLRVAAPGQPVVFAKLYDVAPDGTSSLINGLIAPVRISDPSQPVPVTMPAIVHRFEPGHSVRLAITGGDISFRGGLQGMPVTIFADGSGPSNFPSWAELQRVMVRLSPRNSATTTPPLRTVTS